MQKWSRPSTRIVRKTKVVPKVEVGVKVWVDKDEVGSYKPGESTHWRRVLPFPNSSETKKSRRREGFPFGVSSFMDTNRHTIIMKMIYSLVKMKQKRRHKQKTRSGSQKRKRKSNARDHGIFSSFCKIPCYDTLLCTRQQS